MSREELRKKLWPVDTFVDFDVGLNSAIRKLRQALNDDADSPRYIETLAKRGYRFVAQVAEIGSGPGEVVEPATGGLQPHATSTTELKLAQDDGAAVSTLSPKRSWLGVLVGATLLLLALGTVLWWRGKGTPPLATEQRITANPPEAPVTAAVISFDGKYVAYSDPTGVYIRHIDSGETRALQLPKDFHAFPTSWFPDGTHLLLSTGEAPSGFLRPAPESYSLWKVSLVGGNLQKLVENASGGAVSPDGSAIAFVRGEGGTSGEIWVMRTDGGQPERVLRASASGPPIPAGQRPWQSSNFGFSLSSLAWAPDGRRLAFLRRYQSPSPFVGALEDKGSLEIVDVKGGQSQVLRVSRQILTAVCWAPDGRLLYGFRDNPSSERMDYDIWSIRINRKTGLSVGKEMQLTKGSGRVGGLSVSADGKRLILVRDKLSPSVFVTDMNIESGQFSTLRRLTLDDNPSLVYDWTPDSRAVLFVSNRSGTYRLFRQAIDQAVPEVLAEGRSILQSRVSPDGKEVLYLAGYNPDAPGQPGNVMAVPIEGGVSRIVLPLPFFADIMCSRNPAKLCLLVGAEQALWFDPATGKVQPFSTVPPSELFNWSISPDGLRLALVYNETKSKITFLNLSDNSKRDVELKGLHTQGMDWASDSKRIYVTSQTADGSPTVLVVEPSGNYRVVLVGEKAVQYWCAIQSPDGRRWALQVVSGENNVWMVENF